MKSFPERKSVPDLNIDRSEKGNNMCSATDSGSGNEQTNSIKGYGYHLHPQKVLDYLFALTCHLLATITVKLNWF